MPEGHTVHRIALQFRADLVGHVVAASSPQGRFAAGAALLDGSSMTAARAVGKQLILAFTGARWLRVHLGLYGSWDFHGQLSDLSSEGTATGRLGAARRRRAVRMSEGEAVVGAGPGASFPPPPVGQVRVRLATSRSLADLRGPTACEVLGAEEVEAVLARIGPDPMHDTGPAAEDLAVAHLTSRRVAVGQLLMDQSVIAGIGNVYRAELLFRARLDPHTPGRGLPDLVARELWRDWAELLPAGVRTGTMLTRADLTDPRWPTIRVKRADRYWVYGRAGRPCRVCGTPVALELMAARKLYWCPTCQR